MASSSLWQRFQQYFLRYDDLGFSIDISRMKFPDGFFDQMRPKIEKAFSAMRDLEAGGIANPDEKRMVGHYWLRKPALAPNPELRSDIEKTNAQLKKFAADVHSGKIKNARGEKFQHVLSIGIGGSALGPQFIAEALGTAKDPLDIYFFDNSDPDGFDRVLDKIDNQLAQTVVVVISKSGGTKETRNGMLEAEARLKAAGLDFAKHAVAITGVGSDLDKHAEKNGWLARFPMWDWVGGRTSVMSAVGLVPMALEGFDIDNFLAGAAAMDERTRANDFRQNAAMLLALMWFYAGNGRGEKDMVVLPYKDRLLLFSRYLQQLVMESLGKRLNLQGERVDQGIAVYGNKGSTDQHAYLQQLRDGVNNFFVTFIRVLESGGSADEVEPGVTAGDYLHGFLLGTRAALFENDRESMTITVPRVDARVVGALIALFERAVGLYASLVGVNAYHQPGVEAGKKAAASILALQGKGLAALSAEPQTAEQIATTAGVPEAAETVYFLLEHLAANGRTRSNGTDAPGQTTF